MKYPDVFSSIFMLSPCCMDGAISPNEEFFKRVEAITSIDQLENAGFFEMIMLASSAAWAPNPHNPPLL